MELKFQTNLLENLPGRQECLDMGRSDMENLSVIHKQGVVRKDFVATYSGNKVFLYRPFFV